MAAAVYSFSIAINVLFFLDIYRHPTLGTWSNWILGYVSLMLFFGLLFLVRFYLPQPYRDQSSVLALRRLENDDPALYRRRLGEIYGADSEYRKYRWSYRVTQKLRRCKNSIVSSLATTLEKVRTFRLKPKWRKGRPPSRLQTETGILSPKSFGLFVGFLGLCATALALWEKTFPSVTPQTMDSTSSVLHFKVENPSSIFDMRDVTLACQVLRIETGPASPDQPVTFTTPIANDNGRVLSERKHFTIANRNPIDFNCGAEAAFKMEKAGLPYYPPRIEIEILIQFKTLWFQRRLSSAGPFVAIWSGDKYRWTEGTTVTVEPVH